MTPEMTVEEAIALLEDLYKTIPTLIFLMKINQYMGTHGPHGDVPGDDVVESVHAQGHPEIPTTRVS
ncbi:hypothetical protein ES703_78807 [subsurface metagenome]